MTQTDARPPPRLTVIRSSAPCTRTATALRGVGLMASVYAGRGTPQASNLYRSTVTERVRGCARGDELSVRWDGEHWWASSICGRRGAAYLVEEPP